MRCQLALLGCGACIAVACGGDDAMNLPDARVIPVDAGPDAMAAACGKFSTPMVTVDRSVRTQCSLNSVTKS